MGEVEEMLCYLGEISREDRTQRNLAVHRRLQGLVTTDAGSPHATVFLRHADELMWQHRNWQSGSADEDVHGVHEDQVNLLFAEISAVMTPPLGHEGLSGWVMQHNELSLAAVAVIMCIAVVGAVRHSVMLSMVAGRATEEARVNQPHTPHIDEAHMAKEKLLKRHDARANLGDDDDAVAHDAGETKAAPPAAASNPMPCPDMFLCSISCEIMRDPVVTAAGNTYERAAIAEWFRTHNTDPLTNVALQRKALTPNHNLRHAIAEWTERQGTSAAGGSSKT